jgi:hypothetical protein
VSRPDARWRTVCKLYQTADMVTYEEAAEALGLDADRDRKVIQNAFRRAGEELLDTAGRALRPVPNVGYRMSEPNEHVTLARERKDRSDGQLTKGLDLVKKADLRGMSPEMREVTLATGLALSRLVDFGRAMDLRQRKTEAAVREIIERVDRSEAETAELRERLARLEQAG